MLNHSTTVHHWLSMQRDGIQPAAAAVTSACLQIRRMNFNTDITCAWLVRVLTLNVCKLSNTCHRKVIDHISYQMQVSFSFLHLILLVQYYVQMVYIWCIHPLLCSLYNESTHALFSVLKLFYWEQCNHSDYMLMSLLWLMLSVYTLTILTFICQGWRIKHFRARFAFTGH
jgi:hypothetical protein